jgi:allophanate hydrolase subunit 2
VGLIGIEQLVCKFKVTRSANRVGIRLEPRIAAHTYELTSTPQCVGTIQVSNDGTVIVLGPEGPTIGGYPMAAAVSSADLSRMGQLRPGDSVTFQPCSVTESLRLLEEETLTRQVRLNLLRLALSI